MLWALRRVVRDRLVRAVAEGVDTSAARRDQEARLEALAHRIDVLEHRLRRDLMVADDMQAARESAAFVHAELPFSRRFWHKHETLRHALSLAPSDGMALEFGVATGETLRIIAEERSGGEVYGFDSFEGLPEDWRHGYPKGTFAMEVPQVPGAALVRGYFDDTLPSFLAEHPGPVAFVHVDCDLYSSTRTVLECLADRLRPGVVLVFDEYFNYPGWPAHEHRAWREFVEERGLRFAYEAHTGNDEQVVVRVLD